MTIGLLKEPAYETRVSLLAEAVATLTKKGITVIVESMAGEKAFCTDQDYEKAGATIKSRNDIINGSDILLCIHQPPQPDIQLLGSKVLVGVYQPLYHPALMKEWAAKNLTVF